MPVNLICPSCGKPLRALNWGYGCTGWPDCKFAIGTTICQKKLTDSQVAKLLRDGKLENVSGFKSKKGTEFSAGLVLEKVDTERGYDVKLDFGGPDAAKMPDLYARCPKCGGAMVKGNWGWECENRCGTSVPYELCHRPISKEEAEAILSNGFIGPVEGFVSKKGTPFNAILKLDEETGRVQFDFPDRN